MRTDFGTVQIPDRVLPRVFDRVVMGAGCCWVSTYSTASHGYAQIGWKDGDSRSCVTAHRVAWTAVHGPIPEGMTVDHVCRNRRCVNPAHLRLLTNEENGSDNGRVPVNPLTDRLCNRGHRLALGGGGKRYCRECQNRRDREKRRRRRF